MSSCHSSALHELQLHMPSRRRQLLCACVMLVTLTILPSVSGAAVVRLLNSRSGALQAGLELIKGAQCSIDIATYSIYSDSSCNQMMGELIHARRRSVRVRILVDSFKHNLSNHIVLSVGQCRCLSSRVSPAGTMSCPLCGVSHSHQVDDSRRSFSHYRREKYW